MTYILHMWGKKSWVHCKRWKWSVAGIPRYEYYTKITNSTHSWSIMNQSVQYLGIPATLHFLSNRVTASCNIYDWAILLEFNLINGGGCFPPSSSCTQFSTSSGMLQKSSFVDPEWFIPDPDPALNFPSSGSGSRQKFRISADSDPAYFS